MKQWILDKYVFLLRIVPSCMEAYMGTDSNGASIRRYAVIQIGANEENEENESDIQSNTGL
jgi:hypothetical protein